MTPWLAPLPRRRWITAASSALLAALVERTSAGAGKQFMLFTFGDSVLDCAHYNSHGLHPGRLIVRNDDALFPEFKGKDLMSRGPAQLQHHAVDGSTVDDLPGQLRNVAKPRGEAAALLTIGGNDLLRGLAADSGPGLKSFAQALERFVRGLPVRPVLLGTVYDPTFGDDARNFLAIDARIARANHRRVNDTIAATAARYGRLVDLHAHFLQGNPSWFVNTIEPSLTGASEVRRAFLSAL
jgi:acyl-CoA thioesterase I